jgi:ABC-2 type transport system ATP-binding protein
MRSLAIDAEHIIKNFGSFVAVNDVNLQIEPGIIFGLLGANGAGKSTLIRILCGLLATSSGNAQVGGYDVNRYPEKVKQQIGYMSQKFSLYEDLKVVENIRFFGGVYGLNNHELKKQAAWITGMAGLAGQERRLTRELPVGLKQRLALGCALIHRPRIVFLDEPTGGVDPLARRNFWDLINTLSEEGTTVIVTTHYLDEAEYCNRIMLMHAGINIAEGSPRQLKEEHLSGRFYELDCRPLLPGLEALQTREWVKSTAIFGDSLHISLSENSSEKQVIQFLKEQNIVVVRLQPIAASLEDVFIHLIESRNQEGKR